MLHEEKLKFLKKKIAAPLFILSLIFVGGFVYGQKNNDDTSNIDKYNKLIREIDALNKKIDLDFGVKVNEPSLESLVGNIKDSRSAEKLLPYWQREKEYLQSKSAHYSNPKTQNELRRRRFEEEAPLNLKEFEKKYRDSVVAITVAKEVKGRIGSGFIVKDKDGDRYTYVITANHVVDGLQGQNKIPLFVEIFDNGQSKGFYRAEIVVTGKPLDKVDGVAIGAFYEDDFAVLRFKTSDKFSPAKVTYKGYEVSGGQTLVGIGCAAQTAPKLYRNEEGTCVVESVNKAFSSDSEFIITKTKIITRKGGNPGDSGSPVFDKLGRVVGIYSQGQGKLGKEFSIFIPISLIRTSLKDYNLDRILKN